MDPEYGRAYAALALVYLSILDANWLQGAGLPSGVNLSDITKFMREAEKHPSSTSHQVAGNLARLFQDYNKAIAEFTEAIALDPSDSWSYAFMAQTLTLAGRPKEALPYIKTAMRIDPRYPPAFLFYLGFVQFSLDQFEAAVQSLEKAAALNPEDQYAYMFLAAAYGHLSQQKAALSAIAAYNELARDQGQPQLTARHAWYLVWYRSTADRNRLYDGLLLAGVPDVMPKSP